MTPKLHLFSGMSVTWSRSLNSSLVSLPSLQSGLSFQDSTLYIPGLIRYQPGLKEGLRAGYSLLLSLSPYHRQENRVPGRLRALAKATQIVSGSAGRAGQSCQTESHAPLPFAEWGAVLPHPSLVCFHHLCLLRSCSWVSEVLSQPFRGAAELLCHWHLCGFSRPGPRALQVAPAGQARSRSRGTLGSQDLGTGDLSSGCFLFSEGGTLGSW